MALVVDNNVAVRLLLVRMFESLGFAAMAAKDGRDAFRVFESGRFAVAFVDVDLGVLPDGIYVAARLKDRDPALNVVLMSGDYAHLDRARREGFAQTLAKPFLKDDLRPFLPALPS